MAAPFTGVIPANVLPFDASLAIDDPAYRRHLSWLAGVDGVGAIVVNGHAAEGEDLARDARAEGAAAVLVFPPSLLQWGGALVQLGRIPRATVRPPLLPLDDLERRSIGAALAGAGLVDGRDPRPGWPPSRRQERD